MEIPDKGSGLDDPMAQFKTTFVAETLAATGIEKAVVNTPDEGKQPV